MLKVIAWSVHTTLCRSGRALPSFCWHYTGHRIWACGIGFEVSGIAGHGTSKVETPACMQ